MERAKHLMMKFGGMVFPLVLSIFVSCITNPREEFGPIPLAIQGVYVLNEGNFRRGNSTLTLYIPDSNIVRQDVFRAVNGKDLGDTGNEMIISGTRAFIVMNGSDKIEVVRTSDLASVHTINLKAGRSPYSMAILGSRGYVTNLYAASVTVIDINLYTVLRDSIAVGPNPQGIVAAAGKIYVCNSGFGTSRTISVIDPNLDRVIRTIPVGDGPRFAKLTPDGRLWVLCEGSYGDYANPNDDTPGKIFIINPFTDFVLDSILVGGHPGKMAISFDGFAYVVGDNRVLKYNTRINQLVTGAFAVGSLLSNLYSLGVEDFTGDVYVGNARDFVQNGEVLIYRSDGSLKGRFDAGVIPGTILFKR